MRKKETATERRARIAAECREQVAVNLAEIEERQLTTRETALVELEIERTNKVIALFQKLEEARRTAYRHIENWRSPSPYAGHFAVMRPHSGEEDVLMMDAVTLGCTRAVQGTDLIAIDMEALKAAYERHFERCAETAPAGALDDGTDIPLPQRGDKKHTDGRQAQA